MIRLSIAFVIFCIEQKTIPDKKLGKIKKTDAETPGIRHPRTGGNANGLKRSQKTHSFVNNGAQFSPKR